MVLVAHALDQSVGSDDTAEAAAKNENVCHGYLSLLLSASLTTDDFNRASGVRGDPLRN